LQLADSATLEEVAAILWDEPTAARRELLAARGGQEEFVADGPGIVGPLGLLRRCQVRLAGLAAVDLAGLGLTRSSVAGAGRLILAELAACVGGAAPAALPAHRQLASVWELDEGGADLVRRCLVLLADHELNASTFVARCVASTGATPYAVVSAALAALSGRGLGGASAAAEALCRELLAERDPLAAMAARLARDETLPGLGQPLYPDGDPRAAAILAAAKTAAPGRADWIEGIAAAAMRLTGQRPNVDFALGAAACVLGLPPGAAFGIFLLARSAGWIAHAIEQYESGMLIRPRARYLGRRPSDRPAGSESAP
jgi:citrate synthase